MMLCKVGDSPLPQRSGHQRLEPAGRGGNQIDMESA